MFAANHNLARTLICTLISVSFFSANAKADGDDLQSRIDLQAAEIHLLQAQLELESWKLTQVEGLHNKGFASWLELQRQQLDVEAAHARLNSATEFQAFLQDVAAEHEAVRDDKLIAMQDRTCKPIKVFVPGSVRLVGWIEGQKLAALTIDNTLQQQRIAASEAKLSKAQQRFAALTDSPSASPDHRQIAELRLKVAKAEFERAKLYCHVFTQPSLDASEMSISLPDLQQFVTADQDAKLALATAKVASAESEATGHIVLAKSMLARQQRRIDALQELQSHGAASPEEIEMATRQLTALQSQLDDDLKNQLILRSAVTVDSDSNLTLTDNRSAKSWPPAVLQDDEFVLHLIGLRQRYHELQVDRLIAENRLELLHKVLPRLEAAVLSPESIKSDFQSTLQEGQRNEVASYESEIEIVKAAIASAKEKQQILVHEETRFVLQAVAQYDAARDSLAAAASRSSSAVGMLGLISSPVAMLASNRTGTLAPRFSYLESGANFDWKTSTSFVFSYQNVDFLASPYTSDSLNRLRLRSARNLLLASESLQTDSASHGLALEPNWMNYFRQSYERNADSALSYGLRPSRTVYWSPNYGLGVDRSFGTNSAYPYGILRNDLRSRVMPGQVPWYLPGSPTNIRRNQLPYSYRDGDGR